VITVTSDEGSQDLITDPQDPQIQNILTAIENVEKDAAWRPRDN
jgi:hypothetical protein